MSFSCPRVNFLWEILIYQVARKTPSFRSGISAQESALPYLSGLFRYTDCIYSYLVSMHIDSSSTAGTSHLNTRVMRLRLKDKHASVLRYRSMWFNQVWNYCNDLQQQVWRREKRFLSGYDFSTYTKGASKAGIPLHSQSIQGIAEEYAVWRKEAKRIKLLWSVSRSTKRSLGWIPFKASAVSYRNGQLGISGIDIPLSPWDSYGLSKYQIGAGSISKDARGRWYINMTVKVARELPSQGKADLGIDLGLKDFAAFSDQSIDNVEAK